MNKNRFFYLFWLLPLYFVWLGGYQLMTLQGIDHTFNNGNSLVADVVDFDIKQIAAQTNGYVELSFVPPQGERVQRRLALPVQMAQVIMESERIPIRYLTDSFQPVVMVSTYGLQKSIIKVNLAITGIALLITMLIAFFATRHAHRKIREGEDEMIIERIEFEPQSGGRGAEGQQPEDQTV